MSIYKEQLGRLHTGLDEEALLAAARSYGGRKSVNKALVIPIAAAAAMSVGVVSVGASCSWDFKSLLISDYSRERKMIADAYKEAPSWFSEPFMYEGTVDVPEGAEIYHEMTGKELELLDRISVPVEKTFAFDDLTLEVHGVQYDGYVLSLRYTTINNSGLIDLGTDDHQFVFDWKDENGRTLINCWGGTYTGADIGTDRVTITQDTQITVPDDIKAITFTIGKGCTDSTGFTSYPECGEFTVELPDVSGLERTYSLDGAETTRLGGYGISRLRTVSFSPLGVFIDFDFNLYRDMQDITELHLGHPPVYITMNDGTVIPEGGGQGNYDYNEDGTFYCSWQLCSKYHITDVHNIASVQIGNAVIELDDSMITERNANVYDQIRAKLDPSKLLR